MWIKMSNIFGIDLLCNHKRRKQYESLIGNGRLTDGKHEGEDELKTKQQTKDAVPENNQESDDRVLPVTINSCPIGGATGNPYSIDELRNKAEGLGGAFTSVSSVSVVYSNGGETSSLSFGTNRGSVTISGSEFKQAFNLRAPGYIAIRSPLFNVVKKW